MCVLSLQANLKPLFVVSSFLAVEEKPRATSSAGASAGIGGARGSSSVQSPELLVSSMTSEPSVQSEPSVPSEPSDTALSTSSARKDHYLTLMQLGLETYVHVHLCTNSLICM